MEEKKKSNWKVLLLLHLMLMVYSVSGILSKLAGNTLSGIDVGKILQTGEGLFSAEVLKICLYYAGLILLLGFYAVGWQQIIKHLPLTTAYANKAVSVVWGLVWGLLLFEEKLTVGKILGVILVVGGVVLYAVSDTEDKKNG